MLFPSYIFIFLFAPIAIGGFWLLKNDRARRFWLTLASYIFYGYWDWRFCGLLVISTVVDYTVGLKLGALEDPRKRKAWLILSLAANLGLLGFFKYAMLFADTASGISQRLGGDALFADLNIILPIGISFFTFQSMSYTIDVYRRKVEPTTDIIEFAAFVSLFPQLIAGPIVRYSEICDTLRSLPKKLSIENLHLGSFYFTAGLIKKVLVADRIAEYIDPMFANYQSLVPLEAWIAMLGYSMQIFFDFAGYSLMAIGLGHFLGFRFPWNFNSPYKAVSISDFWRRWHMTLSRWLRDYLYIPLGGRNNRYIALAATMLLGGLWHGADWAFMVWGAYHAVLLQLHHVLKSVRWIPRNIIWARIGTYILVTIGWVFFVAGTDKFSADSPSAIQIAWTILKKMFDFPNMFQKFTVEPILIILIAIAILWSMLAPNMVELVRERKAEPRRWWAIALGILTALCILYLSESSPFLYFQF